MMVAHGDLPPVLGRRLVLFVADLLHPVDDLAVEVFLDPTSLDVPSAPKSEDSGDHACRLYRQKRIAWLDELTNTPGRAHRSRRVRRSGGRAELHEGGDQARCQQVRDQPLDAHARGAPGTEASRTDHALGGAHGRGRAPTGAN